MMLLGFTGEELTTTSVKLGLLLANELALRHQQPLDDVRAAASLLMRGMPPPAPAPSDARWAHDDDSGGCRGSSRCSCYP